MARVLRLFLLSMLMLTLPLQGVSAAVMAMQMENVPAQAEHFSTVAVAYSGCHEMAGMQMDAGMPQDHAPQGDHHPAKTKACGSCCTGAMLGAIDLPAIAAPTGRDRYFAQLSLEPKGFIPDGLERPPRRIS
ncbi:MAG: hypothetical protein RJA63_677 [Pseudomonadota bacterium]